MSSLIDLQERLTYQEQSIEALSQELYQQQQQLSRLQHQLELLHNAVINGQNPLARPDEETPPPHY